MDKRVKYMLPKPENFLRVANRNIVGNLRNKHEAHVVFPPLIERAYIMVNETGAVPYRDYLESTALKARQ